ncbi:Bacterial type II secretion system protein F domain protein [Streptomyces sp. ADI96-02]|uniref:type II secretion system F family protein n=1 Tax=Streptomyces sp. ADI96-02 TaxID=1522760 RepID=UPI000F9D4EF2|nr:type II secretion system F family protein [Streptomyces sp. ADI96-02]RPK62967.1 Bacterial type II secretion system protein F domain protein [Streptomyces sp. ADI96-02]
MTGVSWAYEAHAAALCAGAAAWLVVMREPGARRARLLFAHGAAELDQRLPRRPWPVLLKARDATREWAGARREWWCVPVAVLLALLGASVLPLIVGAVAVPLVRRWLRRRDQRRERERGADAVTALCGAMVGELRAGREPGQALLTALDVGSAEAGDRPAREGAGRTSSQGGWLGDAEAAVLAAARFGGDVPAALRQASERTGLGGLAGMAACWRVAVDGGAGLASGLDRLDTALRAERRRRDELRAQLAGAWSTVVVLALLPVAGLGLGAALGADPLRVLLHTPGGLVCLTVGGMLEAAGLYWACRIVRAGEAP